MQDYLWDEWPGLMVGGVIILVLMVNLFSAFLALWGQ